MELEIAEDDFLVGGGSGAEAPEIHSEGKRNLGYARGVIGRGEGKSLEDICGGAEGLQATHDGADDFGGRPFEASSGECGAVGIVGEVIFHGAEGFVTGGGIESEVGVAAMASVIPLRELDVDFVFGVNANTGFGAIIKKTKDCGGIKLVDSTFDLPLIGAEAKIPRGEDFGGSVGSVAVDDAKMQVAVGIDGNVGRIGADDSGDATVAGSPSAAHPFEGAGGEMGGAGQVERGGGKNEWKNQCDKYSWAH